jgi:hypothetical protein
MGMDTALAIFQADGRAFESRRPLHIRTRNLFRGSASFLPLGVTVEAAPLPSPRQTASDTLVRGSQFSPLRDLN